MNFEQQRDAINRKFRAIPGCCDQPVYGEWMDELRRLDWQEMLFHERRSRQEGWPESGKLTNGRLLLAYLGDEGGGIFPQPCELSASDILIDQGDFAGVGAAINSFCRMLLAVEIPASDREALALRQKTSNYYKDEIHAPTIDNLRQRAREGFVIESRIDEATATALLRRGWNSSSDGRVWPRPDGLGGPSGY